MIKHLIHIERGALFLNHTYLDIDLIAVIFIDSMYIRNSLFLQL